MSQFTPFSFLHVNDIHFGTARSYRFRPAINRRWAAIKRQMCETAADFLLIGGDLTRDGDLHEAEYQIVREELETLPFPFFVIPGNQDVGNKHTDQNGPDPSRNDIRLNMKSERLKLFASYFGPINWTFIHKEVRFTGFFAAVCGSGLEEEAEFWDFMEHLSSLPPALYHIAMMHYWPFINKFHEPNWNISDNNQYLPWYFCIDNPFRERIFSHLLASKTDVLLCGHVHTGRPVEVVDGIQIYKTSATGNTPQLTDRWAQMETRSGFQLCHISKDKIMIDFIPCMDHVEDEDSYGLNGHPRVEERDYSLAREKPPLTPDYQSNK